MKKIILTLVLMVIVFLLVTYQYNLRWLISNKYTQIHHKIFVSKKIPRPTEEVVKKSSITVTCGGTGLLPMGATLRGKTSVEGSGKIIRHQVTVGSSNTKEDVDTFSTTTYANILYEAYDKNIFALSKLRPTSMNFPTTNCTVTFKVDNKETVIDTNNLRGLKEYEVLMKYARGIESL